MNDAGVKKKPSDVKILVCCHKSTSRLKDPTFPAILLGSYYAEDKLKEEYADEFFDSMGENIAKLHPYCAELTAIYWAWKNYDKLENPKYIGLFHYRRYFNFKNDCPDPDLWKDAFFDFSDETRQRFGWDEETIYNFCNGHDMVLPRTEEILDPNDWATPATLETHYAHGHHIEDFDMAMDLVKKVHPDYADAVERTRNLHQGHFCNMFIMRKELFFDYAKWLFDIILPLSEKLNLNDSKYNGAQKRVLGFLGERLFNVWIQYQKVEKKADVLQVQRLMGYLSPAEQSQFVDTYGIDVYNIAYRESKLNAQLPDCDPIDVGNAILYPSRLQIKPDVSVLVAVYNVGPFIRECVESLINQTHENCEFIFVDNCSTDESMNILQYYYRHDPRIVLIQHKKNSGLATSRNTAMRFAKGKYIAFVDGDDVCDAKMYEKLYKKAENLEADIVACSAMAFVDSPSRSYLYRPLEWYGNSDKLLPLSLRPQLLMEPAAWGKLFRASYIKGLDYFEFREKTIAWEDVPAMTSAFIQTDRIATVREGLYYYRQRSSGNLSNNMNHHHVDDFVSGVRMQEKILKEHNYTDFGVLSNVEVFKLLFFEHVQNKICAHDLPYLFHHAAGLFEKKNKKYLEAEFQKSSRRKWMYRLICTHSLVLYILARLLFRFLKGTKKFLQHVFDIHGENGYRVFKIGPFKFRQFRKKAAESSIQWYQQKFEESQSLLWNRNKTCVDLQKKVDTLNRQFEETKKAKAALHGKIQNNYIEIKRLKGEIAEQKKVIDLLTVEKKTALQEKSALLEETERLKTDLQSKQKLYEQTQKSFEEKEEQYQNLNNLFSKLKQETDGFYRAVWTTGWVDVWKEYYLSNHDKIEEKTKKLLAGMDEKSTEWVKLLCYRNFELLPMQKDSALFLYNHWKIYTKEELEGAKKRMNESEFRERYKIPNDVYLEVPVFKYDCGLKCLPEKITASIKGRDIIDGGAYWGDSALVLNGYAPRKIISFEPQPDTYKKLQKVIADNGLSNVVTVHACIGDRNGETILYTEGMVSGSSVRDIQPVLNNQGKATYTVEMVDIDTYVKQNDLNVGFIKLDIEGSESAAIRGALETIKKNRPILSVAVYHDPKDLFDIKPLIEEMGLGYKFMVRKLVYDDLVTEFNLLAYTE